MNANAPAASASSARTSEDRADRHAAPAPALHGLEPADAAGRGEHRASATGHPSEIADGARAAGAGCRPPCSDAMRQNPLGRSELTVSAVGLGCNNFGRRLDKDGTRAVIDAALDHGITFIDTADIYGGGGASEQLIGELLEGRRDRVVLATKFGMDMGEDGDVPRGSRAYARRAVEASLAPAADRRHRPLLPARAGRRHAARREHRRARGARRRGQDPHLRRLQPRRGAAARGRRRRATTGSSRCRTSTTCSSARTTPRCCRSRASTASATSRSSRWRAGC